MALLKGTIKGITTRSQVDEDTGAVRHVTAFKIQMVDLDRETLEALALGEHTMRLLGFELLKD